MSSCISILGSTGSIGRQTLDVVDKLGLRVAALTAEPGRGPAWRRSAASTARSLP